MSDQSASTGPPPETLMFVCWQGRDGARVASAPLAREQAEALARAHAAAYPRQKCWVEPVPWLEPRGKTAGSA